MFWAGIRFNVTSDLVPCFGDPQAQRGGVTARVYKEMLEEYLPTIMDHDTIFQQDNAPIHTSRLLRAWLAEQGFQVLDWLPYSPDLNPIENLWFLLKEAIFKKNPELSTMPKNDTTLKLLCELAVMCWLDLDKEMVNGLIDSMPRRIEAVVKAQG